MYKNINSSELRNMSSCNIIDIRSIQKYNDGHILNAKNIPFDQIILFPYKYLDKESIYYIYCQKGNKSRYVCQILTNKGYNVVNINGGYEAWILY